MNHRISTLLSPALAPIVAPVVGLLVALGLTSGCAAHPSAIEGTEQAAASARPSLGRDASVTVYPVSLAGQSVAQVGEVLGMMLERGGMEHLELATGRVPQDARRDLAAATKAFAECVKSSPPATDYALYCEFLGTPGRSVEEVRTILVAKSGEVLWSDGQTSKDADFRAVAPDDPMECCVLAAKRLTPVFELADPSRADAPDGKLAQRWKRETALPDAAEEAAIAARMTALRSSLATSTVGVFTPHAPKVAHASGAALVQRLTDAGFAHVAATAGEPKVAVRSGMNQQMVLWSFARSFSAWVKANPPATDYVLHTDYLMGQVPNGEISVMGVHVVVCDKQGELVLVDFQNSHQPDFKAIGPKSGADCDRLVARRLTALLK